METQMHYREYDLMKQMEKNTKRNIKLHREHKKSHEKTNNTLYTRN